MDSLPLGHKGIPGVNPEGGESGDSWNVNLNKGELVNLEPVFHHTELTPWQASWEIGLLNAITWLMEFWKKFIAFIKLIGVVVELLSCV